MKKIFQNRFIHYLIVLAAVGFGIYAFFYASPTGQAISNVPLGSITGTLLPNPGTTAEKFTIQFDSYSAVGNRNLTGWTLRSGDVVIYTFVDVWLQSGDSFAVCSAAIGGCDDTWSGGQVWLNEGGTFTLRDADGAVILSRTYTEADAGQDEEIIEIVEVSVPVHVKNDKIGLCHETNKGTLQSKRDTVGKFVRAYEGGKKGHHQDSNDIIPGFYYDTGSGLQYYAGLNWPEQKTTLDNNCA